MSISKLTYTVKVDHVKNETTVNFGGARTPAYCICSTSPAHVAAALRFLANQAMETAFQIEHSADFAPAHFTNDERRKMADLICDEYRNVLERS